MCLSLTGLHMHAPEDSGFVTLDLRPDGAGATTAVVPDAPPGDDGTTAGAVVGLVWFSLMIWLGAIARAARRIPKCVLIS